jgi:hypothetical protein
MKKKYIVSIIITSLIGITSLVIYVIQFGGGLSVSHSVWGEFGDFFGGVISPLVAILAFITVLYNFDLSKDQFQKNAENSTFFSLLDLHNKKVSSITYLMENKLEIQSFHAFKLYNEAFKRLASIQLINLAKHLICENIDAIGVNGYRLLWEKLSKLTKEFINEDVYYGDPKQNKKIKDYLNQTGDKWELLKGLICTDYNTSSQDEDVLQGFALVYIMDTNPSERVKFIQHVYSYFYEEYGHILGHFFRNVHYILENIDIMKSPNNFANIFRAQLSRYELSLLFYNALSNMTSRRHIELLMKYDILNGLYSSDIFYSPDNQTIKMDLTQNLININTP